MEFLGISSLGTAYIYILSRSSINLNRRSKTLDLIIQRERRLQIKEQRTKPRRGDPGQPAEAASKEKNHEDKEGHMKVV